MAYTSQTESRVMEYAGIVLLLLVVFSFLGLGAYQGYQKIGPHLAIMDVLNK